MSCTVAREMNRFIPLELCRGRRWERCHPWSWHPPQEHQKAPCKEPESQDIYQRLLVKLYNFLAEQTNATFNQLLAEEAVHAWHQPAAFVPFQDDLEGETFWPEDKRAVVAETLTGDLSIHPGGT